MNCSLIGLYVVFVMGGQVTVIPYLCGISSALLHYFLLAFFAWTTVEAVWLCDCISILYNIIVVPFPVVGLSGGAGHDHYVSDYL